MTHLDLFSGIGGFALAAGWAGFETIGFSEIDDYASRVLAKHWPHVKNYGDIKNIKGSEIGTVELITGGFPCQPFSVAGKQRGKEDNRHLWPEMFRVISEVGPRWVLGENVAGIVKMELWNCVSDLEGIGYEVQPVIIPACAVDAPHRRDRVWIVAYADAPRKRRESREKEAEGNAMAWNAKGDTSGKERRVQEGQNANPRGICEDVADSNGDNDHSPGSRNGEVCSRQSGSSEIFRDFRNWLPEPPVGRVANGIPNRSHRLKGLGNAIVPAVAYEILRLMT